MGPIPAIPKDEKELLHLIAAGDQAAFTVLFGRHWAKTYSFLARMVKSHEIAEELVNDIFTKLWTGRELIAEIDNMDAFLSKVAYNKAISFFRFTARQKKLQAVIAAKMGQLSATGADVRLLDSETNKILQRAIEQLSPQRKLVFTLGRQQGMTHEQIAQQLNLSTKTVKKTMSNALRSIRGFLSDNGVNGATVLFVYLSQ